MSELEKEIVDESEDKNYKLYIDERKLLIEALRESSQTFDKAILTLASGSFGFTIAFLKDIAPKPFANTLWLLAFSWFLFAVSLIVILFSFLASQKACNEGIDIAFDVIVKGEIRSTPWRTITTVCNYISIIALIAAIIFWGCFAYFNIHYTN
ncbi:MAG: hypothetical protein NTZ27_00895 [Ignavibacteriales bacterium]|nr:hypothetical protein [Ignavibacteriales bacterium]